MHGKQWYFDILNWWTRVSEQIVCSVIMLNVVWCTLVVTEYWNESISSPRASLLLKHCLATDSILVPSVLLFSYFQLELCHLFLFYQCHNLTSSIPPPQPFYAPFSGTPPGWSGARRELLDFMVQGKINRGRHWPHPTGRHSIRTNQCPPPPSPIKYNVVQKYLINKIINNSFKIISSCSTSCKRICYIFVILYASETWSMTHADTKSLEVMEMWINGFGEGRRKLVSVDKNK